MFPAVIASIEFYDIVLFVHVAAIVLAFGPTFGYAFFQGFAERYFPRSIPNVMRTFAAVDRFLVIPGLLIVIAGGIYLVLEGPWDWDHTFVNVGLTAVILLLILQFAVLSRVERKLAELAERDIAASGAGDVELSDEYWAVSRRSAIWGSLAGIIVLVTIFFMVVKP